MAKFEIGDVVMVANKQEKRGLIQKVLPSDQGIVYYDITFFSGQTGSYAEMQLQKAFVATDPWKLFANNQHKGYQEFGLVTTFHKVRNTTNNTLSTLKASRTEFKSFQYKPLVKFLNSANRRILVADEVGLGKTIEAGHIMMELAARSELKDALIICPKSLKNKWQDELREKFNFHFKIISSRKNLVDEFTNCQSSGDPLRAIVTYAAIRTKTADRRDLSQELNPFILELQKTNYFFDLIICDEAHYVRNPNLTHRGLRKIADQSKAVVFLTATPMMTGIDNLYQLLSLLDHEMFYDNTVFRNAVNLNKPFIKALNQLNIRESFSNIKDELLEAEVIQSVSIGKEFSYETKDKLKNYFVNDPLFNRVLQNLNDGISSPLIISDIQKDLTDLNSLNHLYTRTRKREVFVDGKIATRKAYDIFVELTDEERNAYNRVVDEYSGIPLALVTKKRQVSSCIPAYYTTEVILKSGVIPNTFFDSKYDHLKRIVKQVVIKNNKKLIIFAFFRKTLIYLKNCLEAEGIQCVMMHGLIDDRQKIINEFRENNAVKIFLSSQVGTEGVDLQFCNAIVNYDLPWNPMVVEQRIGRIDRIGQKEEIINIYNLILKSTIEEQIYRRLLQRIEVFRESIGDLESIFADEEISIDNQISYLENELYGVNLTEMQRQEKIDAIAVAIENQKKNLELIKRELTDSMVNDVYFENAINDILKNQQYITDADLVQYIKWFIKEKFPVILFNKTSDNEFVFTFPKGKKDILFAFVEESLLSIENKEIHSQYHRFKTKYYGNQALTVTFNQDFASSNPSIEYINAYHPLVLSITDFIEKSKLHINQVFHLSIAETFLSEEDISISQGDYMMCVYKIIVERSGRNLEKKNEYLHPVVLNANSEYIDFLPEEQARFLFGKAQQNAIEIDSPIEFKEEIIDKLRPEFLGELNKIKENYDIEENFKIESFKQRRRKQIDQYYQARIKRLKSQIEEKEEGDRVLPIFLKNLEDAENEYAQRIEGIEKVKLFVDNALISISYIQVT